MQQITLYTPHKTFVHPTGHRGDVVQNQAMPYIPPPPHTTIRFTILHKQMLSGVHPDADVQEGPEIVKSKIPVFDKLDSGSTVIRGWAVGERIAKQMAVDFDRERIAIIRQGTRIFCVIPETGLEIFRWNETELSYIPQDHPRQVSRDLNPTELLNDRIDLDRVRCLNERVDKMARTIINKPWDQRLDTENVCYRDKIILTLDP